MQEHILCEDIVQTTNIRIIVFHPIKLLFKLVNSLQPYGMETCSGTRIIRYEEGKEAEVFTLVLKGTSEEYWFRNSSQGHNYIEISENELDIILGGGEVDNIEQEGEEQGYLFRL